MACDCDGPTTTIKLDALGVAGAGLAAWHGYRRTGSVAWAAAWAALGVFFPVITTAVALAQGLGKKG